MRPLETARIKRQTSEIKGKTKEVCEKRKRPNCMNVYISEAGKYV